MSLGSKVGQIQIIDFRIGFLLMDSDLFGSDPDLIRSIGRPICSSSPSMIMYYIHYTSCNFGLNYWRKVLQPIYRTVIHLTAPTTVVSKFSSHIRSPLIISIANAIFGMIQCQNAIIWHSHQQCLCYFLAQSLYARMYLFTYISY